jgi:outer membrane protein assembly factor BamB
MVALDSANGNILWRQKTGGWAWAGPALNKAGDSLYFGDSKGNFYALSTADGSSLWDAIEADGSITATPAVSDDHVYFTTAAGTIYAYTLDGSLDWNQTIEDEKQKPVKLFSTPLVQEDQILVVTSQASNLFLVALDLNGKSEAWRFDGRAPKK